MDRVPKIGFGIVPNIVLESDLKSIERIWPSGERIRAGSRLGLDIPFIRDFANHSLLQNIAIELIGPGAKPRRAIFFDKVQGANWSVPWHQDLAIPLKGEIESPELSNWSVKESIVHAHAND